MYIKIDSLLRIRSNILSILLHNEEIRHFEIAANSFPGIF